MRCHGRRKNPKNGDGNCGISYRGSKVVGKKRGWEIFTKGWEKKAKIMQHCAIEKMHRGGRQQIQCGNWD